MHLTDEAKLDRLVPYIVDLLRDDAAVVRAAALRTLLQVVSTFMLELLQGTNCLRALTCKCHSAC